MEVCRWSSWLLPLLGVILLAEALQGVQGEVEIEGPSESECRPYIEKALRNLETVGDATVGQDNEDASSIDNVSIEEKQSDERSVEISEPETETHESQEIGTTTSDEVTQTNDQDVETEESTESVTEEGTQEIAAEENITGEEKEPEEDTHESESVENLEETAPEETTQQEESSEKISVETVEDGESIEELPTVEEASSEKTNDEKVDSLDESTEQTVEKSAETTENKESDESKEQDGTEKEETQSIEADDDATDEQSAASEEKKTESDEQVTKDDDEQDEQESKETEGESETREKRSEEQSVEDEQTEETLAKEDSKEDNSEDTNQNEQSTETAEENETESSEKVNENDKVSSTEEPNEEKEDKSGESDTTLNADEGDSNDTEAETTQSKEEKEAEETIDSKEKEGADETSEQTETVSTEDKEKDETTEDNVEGEKSDEGESGEENGEDAPEEDLINGLDVPKDLRPRDHVEQLLKLDREATKTEEIIDRIAEITLRDLKRLYDNAIKPLETLYKYRDLSNRHYGDAEIFSKPLILFMGPWSGGKSSIINYLLDVEYNDTALRTGAEPSPAYFNLLMYGEDEEVLDGTQLAADYTFSGLQKFGQGLEERLRGVKLPSKLLEKVNIVEIPGILEVRKQVSRVFPFNDACQWFIDRADIIFLVYDPSKLDVGPETEAILDQLKGREYQTRIVLNKADQVKPEELMRIQGALIWNISPLMSSPQPPTMYTTSLWSRPYEHWAPVRLLQAQERAFLRDLRSAVDKRIENKIASARRFAVRVRNHAKMVDCYLTTYYNHKSIFGNRKQVSDAIIDHPQDYHIYEGLSTLTNISRYDLPDPDVYRDFFRLNPLYEFQQLSATCTYFRGCPINKLDIAIAYDLPELVGKHKRQVETALAESNQDQSQGS